MYIFRGGSDLDSFIRLFMSENRLFGGKGCDVSNDMKSDPSGAIQTVTAVHLKFFPETA
jgi:hypothetical protein